MSVARFATSPHLSDRDGWVRLCDSGDIATVAGSDILDAYDYWRGDEALSGRLLFSMSEIVDAWLSRKIAGWLPHAEELRDKALLVVIKAAMRPTSPRGVSFRKNFSHFVEWRALDQLETVDYSAAGAIALLPFDERKVAALIARDTDDREDLIDARNALSRMNPQQLAAAEMHFIARDSLDDIAEAFNVTRYVVTAWLQPLLDIKHERRG